MFAVVADLVGCSR